MTLVSSTILWIWSALSQILNNGRISFELKFGDSKQIYATTCLVIVKYIVYTLIALYIKTEMLVCSPPNEKPTSIWRIAIEIFWNCIKNLNIYMTHKSLIKQSHRIMFQFGPPNTCCDQRDRWGMGRWDWVSTKHVRIEKGLIFDVERNFCYWLGRFPIFPQHALVKISQFKRSYLIRRTHF